MEHKIRRDGYEVLNVGYPSNKYDITALAEEHVNQALLKARATGAERIHFVTHSMGGIIVREYLSKHQPEDLGKVVMIAPPNHGSEVVDRIGHWKLFIATHGPAGQQLGTNGYTKELPAADYELGVIAGSRSINWINSLMISGANDGKVSIASTKLSGMKDHKIIASTHPTLLWNKKCTNAVLNFLKAGSFD